MTKNINISDVLMLARSVASERSIPVEKVLNIFEEALAQSLKRGSVENREADFRVEIDLNTGEMEAFRRWRIVEDEQEVEFPEREIRLEDAKERFEEDQANPGDIIEELFEKTEFDQRVSMLQAKQTLNGRLREAERSTLVEELLARDEILVSGQVLRVLRDKGDVIMEVMRVDCYLPRTEMIPRENVKVGDRIQALIKETVQDKHGPQVILTRTSPEFLVRLFERYVPEIEKGILKIVGAVRAPGNRAKIAVHTEDSRIDPVGTCVGVRGSRVQQVTSELNGERIDIIPWDEDDAKYVLRALAPAEISKINVDRERHSMDILVEPDLMAQAIGKNGTNVRLASELTGWQLNLVTPEEHNKEVEELAVEKSADLAKVLNVDSDIARILYDEGFESLEYVAYAQPSDLLEIEGFSEDVVNDIQRRAREAAEKKELDLNEKLEKIDSRLRNLEGVNDDLIYDLAQGDILSLDALADLNVEELLYVVEIPAQKAGEIIMQARQLIEENSNPSESQG